MSPDRNMPQFKMHLARVRSSEYLHTRESHNLMQPLAASLVAAEVAKAQAAAVLAAAARKNPGQPRQPAAPGGPQSAAAATAAAAAAVAATLPQPGAKLTKKQKLAAAAAAKTAAGGGGAVGGTGGTGGGAQVSQPPPTQPAGTAAAAAIPPGGTNPPQLQPQVTAQQQQQTQLPPPTQPPPTQPPPTQPQQPPQRTVEFIIGCDVNERARRDAAFATFQSGGQLDRPSHAFQVFEHLWELEFKAGRVSHAACAKRALKSAHTTCAQTAGQQSRHRNCEKCQRSQHDAAAEDPIAARVRAQCTASVQQLLG